MNVSEFLRKSYPQNLIIRKPLVGALILFVFTFLFIITYKPLDAHASVAESMNLTMALYALVSALAMLVMISVLKKADYFSREEDWTVLKEVLSIILLLFGLGLVIYFAAFIIEPPAQRWTWSTFFDSVKSAFLVGIIPFTLFSAINYPYLFHISTDLERPKEQKTKEQPEEERLRISSQLKKESLSFFPSQFIFAESDGNYVVFHLSESGTTRSVTIRNTISNVSQQLEHVSQIIRCHRAFLVNLDRIVEKTGNASGYKLKLDGSEKEIPVSRQNIPAFDKLFQ